MEQANPYQAPSADVATAADFGEYDESSPFSPKGRFGRLSYIAWSVLTGFVIAVIAGFVLGTIGATNHARPPIAGLWVPQIATVVVGLLFAMRRLHDFEASGWWSVLLFVPFINFIFGLFLAIKAGSEGPNRFGPPRLTRGSEKVIAYIAIGVVPVMIVAAVVIPLLVHPH